MKNVPLSFPIFLGILALYLQSLFFPQIHLFPLAFVLALFCMRKSLLPCLWAAAVLGTVQDLFFSDVRFGIFTFSSLFAILICYRLRKYFYEESLISLPFYTQILSTAFSLISFSFMKFPLPLTFQTLLIDFIVYPLLDGVFSIFYFICPMLLCSFFTQRKKVSYGSHSYRY